MIAAKVSSINQADMFVGKRMLNECPKSQSCGTYVPIWTDEDGPSDMGVATDIDVWAVNEDDCWNGPHTIEAMRCSNGVNDIIYKQLKFEEDACTVAFCGMK